MTAESPVKAKLLCQRPDHLARMEVRSRSRRKFSVTDIYPSVTFVHGEYSVTRDRYADTRCGNPARWLVSQLFIGVRDKTLVTRTTSITRDHLWFIHALRRKMAPFARHLNSLYGADSTIGSDQSQLEYEENKRLRLVNFLHGLRSYCRISPTDKSPLKKKETRDSFFVTLS